MSAIDRVLATVSVARPSQLRAWTAHSDPRIRDAAFKEIQRRNREHANRQSLTGVVKPL